MLELRLYQSEAVDAAMAATTNGIKRPLVVAPTGSGKSVMIAELALQFYVRGLNVLIACHSSEILSQNEKTILAIEPDAKTGIYSAKLKRKESEAPIILASRDSAIRCLDLFQRFDVMIVDEAHLISTRSNSGYMRLVDTVEPKYIIGFTATPFRLDCGFIASDRGYFDDVVYDVKMRDLINDGYLVPFKIADSKTLIKTKSLKIVRGDFDTKTLTEISSTENVVRGAIKTWQNLKGDRKLTIFFCCSIAHAKVVAKELDSHRYSIAYIDGATDQVERQEMIRQAKLGFYDCIVNVDVLTTGVDIPLIDCVCILRATESPSLFLQIIGRGLRLLDGKKDCLIIDCTDNFNRFESVYEPKIRPKGGGKHRHRIVVADQKSPKKNCPTCKKQNHVSTTMCVYCEHVFINHESMARARNTKLYKVNKWRYYPHRTNSGERCFVVEYVFEGITGSYKQYLLIGKKWAFKHRDQLKNLSFKSVYAVKCELNRNFIKPIDVLYSQKKPPSVGKWSNE